MADWTMAVLTFLVVLLTIANWWIAKHIRSLTGALERHSDQQRQIAAHNAGIELVWWDKSVGGEFPHHGEHNHGHRLERLYIGIPWHRRQNKTLWGGLKTGTGQFDPR